MPPERRLTLAREFLELIAFMLIKNSPFNPFSNGPIQGALFNI